MDYVSFDFLIIPFPSCVKWEGFIYSPSPRFLRTSKSGNVFSNLPFLRKHDFLLLFPDFSMCRNNLEESSKLGVLGSTPTDCDSVSVDWGPRVAICDQFPGEAAVAVLRTTRWDPCYWTVCKKHDFHCVCLCVGDDGHSGDAGVVVGVGVGSKQGRTWT